MKSGNHILLKQMMSAVLLTLIVFIQMIKCLHHHSCSSEKYYSANHLIKKAADCGICDYHFCKDVEPALAFSNSSLPANYPPVNFISASSLTTSIGLASADRGPPAIV